MKKLKGEPGYRNSHRLRSALFAAAVLFVILFQVTLGHMLGGSLRLLFTCTGMISVLPFANILSPLFALGRFRSPDDAFYERMRTLKDRGLTVYDLVFTTKDDIFPADLCLITENELIVLLGSGKKDTLSNLKLHLERSLRLEKLKPSVSVFSSEEAFLARAEALPLSSETDNTKAVSAAQLLKQLSY